MSIKEIIKNNSVLYDILLPIVTLLRYVKSFFSFVLFKAKACLIKMGIVKGNDLVKNMRDRYLGQNKRVFIVATGPSLSIDDLKKLQLNQEITISVNGIFRIFGKTDWRPTYYLLADEGAFRMKEYCDQRYEDCAEKEVLLSELCKPKLKYKIDDSKIGFFRLNRLDHSVNPRTTSHWYSYSSDFYTGIFDFYTVTTNAIQLADYMGIKEIYLLGVDANYVGPKAHVGQEDRKVTEAQIKAAKKQYTDQISGYKNLKRLADLKGVHVYNATRGGALEVFPRIAFDELF